MGVTLEDDIHFRYEIDVERHVVLATFFGDASLTDAQAIVAELYSDPRHSPSMGRVYDCRAVTRMPPVVELRAVADLFQRNVDPAVRVRRAIVVAPGAYYGLGRMLQALLDLVGLEVSLFTELDEAIAWVSGHAVS
ncbi:MAG TPA: hypothetical protein VFZ21_05310 [Gemmatimonadaceae bacterium]|nr:hypothetical protein [Gemmatimonadaceae bacterium]